MNDSQRVVKGAMELMLQGTLRNPVDVSTQFAERYERKSLAITANAPFSAWDEVFPDKAMTVAAVDRLMHHSTILEMNVDSYRRRTALPARRQRSAPPAP